MWLNIGSNAWSGFPDSERPQNLDEDMRRNGIFLSDDTLMSLMSLLTFYRQTSHGRLGICIADNDSDRCDYCESWDYDDLKAYHELVMEAFRRTCIFRYWRPRPKSETCSRYRLPHAASTESAVCSFIQTTSVEEEADVA